MGGGGCLCGVPGQWDPGRLRRGTVKEDMPVNGVSREESGYSSCQSLWERISPEAGKEGMEGLFLALLWGLTAGRRPPLGEPRGLSDMEAACGPGICEGAWVLVFGE